MTELLLSELRRHSIEDEKLAYPDGVAAGETVIILDSRGPEAKHAALALVVGAVISGAVWLFEQPQLGSRIPETLAATLFGLIFANMAAGFSVSLLSIGSGVIVGSRITLSMALGSILSWVLAPHLTATGLALLGAGLVQAMRLARWAGDRTWRDRLVLVLHVAYVFVSLGFILVGLASLWPALPASAGVHAWTGGAIGVMTLAVMSRASLGHTGRALVVTRGTQAVYALIVVAAVARIWAALEPQLGMGLLDVAGLAWAAAFLGFALLYGPVLTRPRLAA